MSLTHRPHGGIVLTWIRSSAGALLLDVAYGLEIQDKDDPYVEAAEKAVDALNHMGNTGTYMGTYRPSYRRRRAHPGWSGRAANT